MSKEQIPTFGTGLGWHEKDAVIQQDDPGNPLPWVCTDGPENMIGRRYLDWKDFGEDLDREREKLPEAQRMPVSKAAALRKIRRLLKRHPELAEALRKYDERLK